MACNGSVVCLRNGEMTKEDGDWVSGSREGRLIRDMSNMSIWVCLVFIVFVDQKKKYLLFLNE